MSIPSAFRAIAAFIFSWGVVMHGGSLIMGRDSFVNTVMKPHVDIAFGLVVTIGAILGLLSWRRYSGSRAGRWIFGFAMFMLLISIPIHLRTIFTQSTDYLKAFPLWYSMIEVPMFIGLAYMMTRLQFDTSH